VPRIFKFKLGSNRPRLRPETDLLRSLLPLGVLLALAALLALVFIGSVFGAPMPVAPVSGMTLVPAAALGVGFDIRGVGRSSGVGRWAKDLK